VLLEIVAEAVTRLESLRAERAASEPAAAAILSAPLPDADRKLLEQTRMHQVRFHRAVLRTLEALRKVRKDFGEAEAADPDPGDAGLPIVDEAGPPSCDLGPIDLEPSGGPAAPSATNEAIATEVVSSRGAGASPAFTVDGRRDVSTPIVQETPDPGADPRSVTNEANRPSASATGLVGAVLAVIVLLFLAGLSAAFAFGEAKAYPVKTEHCEPRLTRLSAPIRMSAWLEQARPSLPTTPTSDRSDAPERGVAPCSESTPRSRSNSATA
jgi:hypothetical protein